MTVAAFYDRLAPWYHFLFSRGFDATTREQARRLDSIIRTCWPGTIRDVLDASCGIGT